MNQNMQQQMNQGFEQYRLEVQNKELLTQINVAKDTINYQNQHIANLYSNMNSLITIFGLIFAIFGIIIPLIMTALSIKNKNELKEIKDNVDDFITNKFKQWENQNKQFALKKYLNGEINWDIFQAAIRWELLSFDSMKKILDAKTNKINLSESWPSLSAFITNLANYVFITNKEINNDDFIHIRKLIAKSEWFYSFAIMHRAIFIEGLKTFKPEELEKVFSKIINIIEKSTIYNLALVVDVLNMGQFDVPQIENYLADKIVNTIDVNLFLPSIKNINILNKINSKEIHWTTDGKELIKIANILENEQIHIPNIEEFIATKILNDRDIELFSQIAKNNCLANLIVERRFFDNLNEIADEKLSMVVDILNKSKLDIFNVEDYIASKILTKADAKLLVKSSFNKNIINILITKGLFSTPNFKFSKGKYITVSTQPNYGVAFDETSYLGKELINHNIV